MKFKYKVITFLHQALDMFIFTFFHFHLEIFHFISNLHGLVLCVDIMMPKSGINGICVDKLNVLKDINCSTEKCNVVYKIPCLGDGFSKTGCDLCYIGHTGNTFGDRISQHESSLIK